MTAPYGSMPHIPPASHHLLFAKQEPFQKSYLLTKNIEEFSGNSQENEPEGRKKRPDR